MSATHENDTTFTGPKWRKMADVAKCRADIFRHVTDMSSDTSMSHQNCRRRHPTNPTKSPFLCARRKIGFNKKICRNLLIVYVYYQPNSCTTHAECEWARGTFLRQRRKVPPAHAQRVFSVDKTKNLLVIFFAWERSRYLVLLHFYLIWPPPPC
jgi:hypothetical protein